MWRSVLSSHQGHVLCGVEGHAVNAFGAMYAISTGDLGSCDVQPGLGGAGLTWVSLLLDPGVEIALTLGGKNTHVGRTLPGGFLSMAGSRRRQSERVSSVGLG